MKLTAIKAQVKNPDRISVYIDGEYSFSLTQSQLVGSGLYIGKELNEPELEKLKDDSEFGKAYMRALDYILRRPRSEKELRDYAFKKQWPKELANKVISHLFKKGHLNDEAFAKSWVRHRALGKPMSEKRLRLELRQKGVSGEHIEAALSEESAFEETDALKRIIEKKRHRYDNEQKLIAYLMRQGFKYDDVKIALAENDTIQ
jgi:regulatory protein